MAKKQKADVDSGDFLDDMESVDLDLGGPSALDQHGVYVFSEEFTYASAAKCIRFILNKNFLPAHKQPKNITLMFMSDGGDLNGCFGLIDIMKGSQIPIHTVGIGTIASSALLAFMAGQQGHRTITPNTCILSHQFSWYTGGKIHELLAVNTEVHRIEKRMLNHIRACTLLKTDDDIRKHLIPPSDVYLEARDAVKLGIADRVSTYYPYK